MSETKGLQIFNFQEKPVRVVMRGSEPWWIAKDVCEILDMGTEQIRRLDDDEKGLHKTQTPGGEQDMSIINESGLYALIIRSNKSEAKNFRKWITSEVLPSIRKTGEYATPEAKRKKADKDNEMAMKRLDIMEKNANCRMAKVILEGMKQFKDVMTNESRTVFMTGYAELTTKQDLKHMLPVATEKWYSATDLANEFGVSAQKIGRLSNEYNLKAPEGESNEYGTWIRSKSEHSSKEVMTWVYYEAARKWFTEYFE